MCVCVWRFVERLKELRITNEKPPLPELYPANSLDALLLKIKTKVIALLGRISGSRRTVHILFLAYDRCLRDYDLVADH